MPAQCCVIGWPGEGVDAAISSHTGDVDVQNQARRINDQVRSGLSGAVHGLVAALQDPRQTGHFLAAELAAAQALGSGETVVFGGPDFAETWPFWKQAMPALVTAVVIQPPPAARDDLHDIDQWLHCAVAGLRSSSGERRIVWAGAQERAVDLAIDALMSDRALLDPTVLVADQPNLAWLDDPTIPASASMLYLGLLAIARFDTESRTHRDSMLLAVADAAETRWRVEQRAQSELRSANLVVDDLRVAYADAEARVTAGELSLAQAAERLSETEQALAQTEAEHRWKLESAEHERLHLEAQLRHARSYIAAVQRTPLYRGFVGARTARDRLRALLSRH